MLKVEEPSRGILEGAFQLFKTERSKESESEAQKEEIKKRPGSTTRFEICRGVAIFVCKCHNWNLIMMPYFLLHSI